jgi:hypothetical protein
MLTNLLKDLGEIGVAIGGDGDMKVLFISQDSLLKCFSCLHGKELLFQDIAAIF